MFGFLYEKLKLSQFTNSVGFVSSWLGYGTQIIQSNINNNVDVAVKVFCR